jgi:MATE family multidrug resistance protein
MLAFNVCCAKNFEHTWEGFSLESFNYVINGVKLALPSAAKEW